MITGQKIPGKIEAMVRRYAVLRFEKLADVPVEMCEVREHTRREPAGVAWTAAPAGTRWGGNWRTAWFRGDAALPATSEGRKVWVRARTESETLFLVDGEPRGVFDVNHPLVVLTLAGQAGRAYHLSFEAYSGHTFPGLAPDDRGGELPAGCKTFGGVELALEREDVTAFVFDLMALSQLAGVLPEGGLRRGRIVKGFEKIIAAIDALPEETGETSWQPRLAEARAIIRPLLEARNGTTAPRLGLLGNSHIDTAWLWPLAETRRKCARTFSSVLNLMEQYPEFIFIQSAPCHAEMIRQDYPGLFERLQRKVAEGRWEPNGGMWVEPDANIPSGESFVRQLLVGIGATREMFGYSPDMLWLPDVFGYSAALPQILRGCGIEFFCTQKISWNDTTRFPYDTFTWKGLDGSAVLTHYITDYACWPNIETLTRQWDRIQHKDVQDRLLCAFGYGDGGGGPTHEMIEVTRRLQDLEGCPRTGYTTASAFMRGVRDELGADLPEWSGELYLEAHRGTLTSIAKIKRGNRQGELALRDAEFLCTLAALRGQAYPAERLLALWKTLLTHQFHDILPGSSIAETNDQSVTNLERCVSETRQLSREALGLLAAPGIARSGNGSTGGTHSRPAVEKAAVAGDDSRHHAAVALADAPDEPATARRLVVNTLSWERTGEITLVDVPAGLRPADPALTAQEITDVEGQARLIVAGLALKPLGGTVLDLTEGHDLTEDASDSHATPFLVGMDGVETPHATVRFGAAGEIVSFIDKASGRECVSPGRAFNRFLSGEDVPQAWDNWDIDADQQLKMRAEERLISREVAACGPLQLRLRSQYRIGLKSTLTQDMVFHAHSPRVDFETMVDWAERHTLLKAGFAVNVLATSARHEIQYGFAERPTHGNHPYDRARFEVCAHKWTDLSEGGFGVALLNDCKYGISVAGTELGLSLLKSGTHPDPRGDEGRHVFTYALLPHACGFAVEPVIRPAYELNVAPLVAVADQATEGFAGLVVVDAPNVIVEAVKWAEKGQAFVVRLYEAGKTGSRAQVTFNAPVRAVSETNLLEENPCPLALEGQQVNLTMRAFEIKTLYCQL